MAKQKEKKKYQIDISEFTELQDAILEYFILMTEILNIDDLSVETITMDADSNKILIEGEIETDVEDPDEPSEDEEDSDLEWI